MMKTITKRLLPLFMTLVVVISLFPAVPASAADSDLTLSGYWLFNANIAAPSNTYDISQNILFTSNGQAFSSITFSRDSTSGTPAINFCSIKYNAVQVKNLVWVSDAYRYVDFGATPQSVSRSFYNWFTSNATKQETPETVFTVNLDGETILTYSAPYATVELHLEIFDASAFVYFESDYDGGFDQGFDNTDFSRFVGLSKYNRQQLDFVASVAGGKYTIDVPSTSPVLNLYSVFEYPLHIDPNGGTWNGSSETSVFWNLPNSDTDEIYDPVRPGYTFDGWTFIGGGEFNGAGDPPYNYEHGTSPGYLTANWTSNSGSGSGSGDGDSSTYTTTITIAGKTLTFTGSGASPDITVTDTGHSVQFTDGVSTKTLSYDILGVTAATFAGLSFTENGTPFLSPGGSYVIEGLTGSDYLIELYPISQDVPDSNAYTTTIVINGKPFEFSSSESYPEVKIRVREAAVQMSDGTTTYVYSYLGSGVFSGLGLTALGEADYPVGTEFTLAGSLANNRFMLYVIEILPPEEDVEFQGGVLGWLKLLYEKISSTVISPELKSAFSIVDFGSIGSFFVDMYNQVKSFFGLKTLIEDPAGPFAWLMES